MQGCLWHAPYWGPGPQPRHVPWLGIEPVTLWFASWCSVHWATPAGPTCIFKNVVLAGFIFIVKVIHAHSLTHLNAINGARGKQGSSKLPTGVTSPGPRESRGSQCLCLLPEISSTHIIRGSCVWHTCICVLCTHAHTWFLSTNKNYNIHNGLLLAFFT